MPVFIPEKERIPGVRYALTQQGVELPVVDVTHPSFALDTGADALQAIRQRTLDDSLQWSRRPRWIRRLFIALVARRSVLMRGLRSCEGTFLTGMNTYLFKLPPAHLASSFATAIDRRIAAKTLLMEIRLRLQLVSEFLAEQLRLDVDQTPAGLPVYLLNIAGGTAIDSLNALLLAQREPSASLSTRPIHIAVLEAHDEGPYFGRNALESLHTANGPLARLNIHFAHQHYDWNNTDSLRNICQDIPADAVCLGSSEGGLFGYATDDAIRANLQALRAYTSGSFTFTGTWSPDTPGNRESMNFSGAASRVFQPDAFEKLLRDTGWRIDRQTDGLGTRCIRLAKA
jgi:hypothetical protein